jgi:hypothetical protein
MSFYIKRTSYPIETGQQVTVTEGYLIGTLTFGLRDCLRLQGIRNVTQMSMGQHSEIDHDRFVPFQRYCYSKFLQPTWRRYLSYEPAPTPHQTKAQHMRCLNPPLHVSTTNRHPQGHVNAKTHTLLTLWRRNFLLNLAHPVYKMWITQEPKKIALWNKRHFEEEKRRVCRMFKIFSTYICWINKKYSICRLAVRYDH